MCERKTQQGSGNGHRYRKKNDERIYQAFELCRQHEVYQYDRKNEGENEARTAFCKVAALARKCCSETCRQNLFRNAVDLFDRFTKTYPRCRCCRNGNTVRLIISED